MVSDVDRILTIRIARPNEHEGRLIATLSAAERKAVLVSHALHKQEQKLQALAEKTGTPYDQLVENLDLLTGKGGLLETLDLSPKPAKPTKKKGRTNV